jgi:predicted anti-sigma-YlaC factor YlaD
MNCRDFHDLVQERLDGGDFDAPPAFDEHLRACPACAALNGAAVRLSEGLRLLAPPAPPPDLAARIVARLTRKGRLRRPRGRRVAVPLALAACLLVAIAARLYWPRSPTPADKPGSGPVVEQKKPAPPDPVDLRASVDEAKQAVVALTARTADEAVDRARRLLPPAPATPAPPPAPAQALREAGEGVSDGLEPVTNSARRAVDLFLRELPPMDLGENRGL